MLDLVISIVNHGNWPLLEPLLASIFNQTEEITYEIYVVDNLPGEGSAAAVHKKFPEVHLISNDRPKGFAHNHNQVMAQISARYTILLNDDMLLIGNPLLTMVKFMDTHPTVGLAGCQLLNADFSIQRSAWLGFPSAGALLNDLFYLAKWLPKATVARQTEISLSGTLTPQPVDHLLGACMMVRRETLAQVGGLDESFGMFLEETDWCYRIKQAGWHIYWVPTCQMIHYGQQSVSRDPQRFVPMLYRNYVRFCKKHDVGGLDLLCLKLVLMAGTLFRSGLWGVRGFLGRPNARGMFLGYCQVALQALWF